MGPVPRRISIPRPHKAFGLCALGFTQFKADGLVQTYGLPTRNLIYGLATRNPTYGLATRNLIYGLQTLTHNLATRNLTHNLATSNHSCDLATSNPRPYSFPLFL